jgi:predicted transcriptional regulator
MHTSKMERLVYDTLLRHPGQYLTTVEVARIIGVDKWSISPRFQPLLRKGLVELGKKVGANSSGKARTLQAWRAIVKPEASE